MWHYGCWLSHGTDNQWKRKPSQSLWDAPWGWACGMCLGANNPHTCLWKYEECMYWLACIVIDIYLISIKCIKIYKNTLTAESVESVLSVLLTLKIRRKNVWERDDRIKEGSFWKFKHHELCSCTAKQKLGLKQFSKVTIVQCIDTDTKRHIAKFVSEISRFSHC